MTCLNYDELLLVKFSTFSLFVLFWIKLSGSYRLSIGIYLFYCIVDCRYSPRYILFSTLITAILFCLMFTGGPNLAELGSFWAHLLFNSFNLMEMRLFYKSTYVIIIAC